MADQNCESSEAKNASSEQRTLVVGATGRAGVATLRTLLAHDRMRARALVRTVEAAERKIPAEVRAHPRFEVAVGSISEMSAEEIRGQTDECSHVVMALGHNGVFARPWNLVTDAHRRIVSAQTERRRRRSTRAAGGSRSGGGGDEGVDPLRMVVLNSAAIPNPAGGDTPQGVGSRAFLALIKALVPPLADSAACSRYMSEEVGTRAVTPNVEWTVVRPGFFHEGGGPEGGDEGGTEVHVQAQGTLLAPRYTSIARLGRFMGELCVDERTWETWRYKMPCVVDREEK